MGALILATALGCAAAGPCPSARDLLAANKVAQAEFIDKVLAEPTEPDEIVLVHSRPVRKVTQVRCSEPSVQGQLRCRFRLHLQTGTVIRQDVIIGRLEEGWRIVNFVSGGPLWQ